MAYQAVIWDFNGTLFDDLQESLDVLNLMLTKRGYPPVESTDRYKEIFGFPIRDYYVKAGFDLEKEDFSVMADEFIVLYNEAARSAVLKDGIMPLLKELKAKDIPMYILSACEQKMLEEYAEKLGIAELIDGIYGTADYLANGKKGIADKLMSERNTENAVLIGDTDHDLSVAEHMNCDCIFVSWGHHSKARLKAFGKDIADTPEELKKFILK